MIDDNWQRYYGNFDFRAEKFSDPKDMVKKMHAQGFKVMLWICPFVSPDSPEYCELAQKVI
jgi:alpha-glucosidase